MDWVSHDFQGDRILCGLIVGIFIHKKATNNSYSNRYQDLRPALDKLTDLGPILTSYWG